MKIKHPSTLDEPLHFFRKFYNEDTIRDWFSNGYLADLYHAQTHFEIEGDLVLDFVSAKIHIYWDGPEEISGWTTTTVEAPLKRLVQKEGNKSIKLIQRRLNTLIEDTKGHTNLAKHFIENIRQIEQSNSDIFKQFPFLQSPLLEIENLINENYLGITVKRKVISYEDEIKNEVHLCIEFLGGLNDENIPIMKQKDYERLLSAITQFLKTGQILELTPRIPKLNGVDKLTIQRTFLSLWKKMNYIGHFKRDSISLLIIELFEQFKNSNPKVIYKTLSKKPSYWKKFVPPHVKEKL